MFYSMSQVIMSIIYLGIMLLSSVLCGYVCSLLKSNIDRGGLFALGFSLNPCLIGTWMILFSFLPGFKNKQIVCLVLFVFFLFIAYYFLRKNLSTDIALFKSKYKDKILILWLAVITFFFVWICLGISGYQVYFDASFYMAEALKFVRSLSFGDIASHLDYVDGTLQGSVHNFLWPGYISFGLLFSTSGNYGIGNDLSAYLSILLAGFYLITAIWGMLIVFTKNIKVSSVVSVLIFLSPIFGIINAYSRDLFRCIPLSIFISILYVDLEYEIEKSKSLFFKILLVVTSYFVMGGHPINAFTAGVVGVVWLFLNIIKKTNFIVVMEKCLWMLIGVLIGAYNFIYALLDTGTLSGNCSLYPENIYQGSSIYQVVMDQMASTMVMNNNIGELIQRVFAGDKYKLCAMGFICSILLLTIYFRKKHTSIMLAPLVYMCSILLIVIGRSIKWGGFSYAEWLSRNPRYMFQFYILAILSIGLFVQEVASYCGNGKIVQMKVIGNILTIVVFFISTFVMIYSYNPIDKREADISFYEKDGQIIYNLYAQLTEGENILISENQYSYITDVKAKVLASYYGKPLFMAQDIDDVQRYLIDNKIRYVCLNSIYLPYYWSDSVFYKSILELCDQGVMSEIEPNIYMMNDSL